MHEHFYTVPESIHEMRGGVEIETDQVDHRVAAKGRDCGAERSIVFGNGAIESYVLDRLPFGRVMVWSSLSAGNSDNIVPLVHEPRHEPGADMSGGSDDYSAHSC